MTPFRGPHSVASNDPIPWLSRPGCADRDPSEPKHHPPVEQRPVEATASVDAVVDAGVGDVLICPADKRPDMLVDLERCAETDLDAEVELTLSGEVHRLLLQSQPPLKEDRPVVVLVAEEMVAVD